MAVTMEDIARLAGVSRGTVDRALHNRGRINAEVAARILKIAAEQGFEPNRVGRALARAKNPIRIGVVAQSARTPFIRKVLQGIDRARDEFASLGAELVVREMEVTDARAQARVIDALVAEGIHGLVLSPADDALIAQRIDALADKGIPCVTFNTDIQGTKRLCFVGQDHEKGGRASAGLMNMITGGRGTVLVLTGYLTNRSHRERSDSFVREMRQSAPDVELLGPRMCFDDDARAEEITLRTLDVHADLAGVFIAASGQAGVCRALRKAGRAGKTRVVCYDTIPETERGLKDGIISFVIDQNAHVQGYQPLRILFDYLNSGNAPEREFYYTDILLKTKYNL